ncbi:MAG: hypothetical protein QM759_07255 [Terricaulis sp.]
MARVRSFLALICVFTASACGAKPPSELAGMWSTGPAACEAGVGVRFEEHAISASYDRQRETLFENPRYMLLRGGRMFRIRIVYDLPRLPGGAYSVGARGVVILARQTDGRIAPEIHNLLDARTGAARLQFVGDPAVAALTLTKCGEHLRPLELRGAADSG